uniref:Uncharacterized protein n=1 Tax=Entomoneis paludosa TaxID=265537 RepID=A0A7S3DY27_9STRA|mmetsp:Transcript_7444/g.15533  ORF Transcript_7444/g.15533 Transcript_7444/m.15533 type:complete len:334 (+) Transcript_7444:127-1128(+)
MAAQEFEYHRLGGDKKNEESWAHDFMFSSVDEHFVETLKQRIPKEIGCAFAASLVISPLVGIIDKCIVQDISGAPKFMTAFGSAGREMLLTPKSFYGSLAFRLTVGVYFGTYAIANLTEAVMTANKIRGYNERKQIKVVAASAANISLLTWRDAVFARMYTTPGLTTPTTPLRTLSLFAARDSGTMFATFYLAPRVAEFLKKEHGVEKNAAELGCALGIPMLAQFATAPMHIHAMHYYQAPQATTSEQMQMVKNEFMTVSMARALRILPAFGLGSYVNNKFRELFIRSHDENKLLTKRFTRFLENNKHLEPHLTRHVTRFSLDGESPGKPKAP